MRTAEADPVDAYLHALGGRLRGPGRLKADLLAEARDSLEDAASAYEESGLDQTAARRLAVADFGEPGVLAPGYQRELAAAQGRRLARLMALLPVAMLLADTMWWERPGTATERPPTAFLLVTEFADWTSYAAGALSLVALVLLGRPRGPHPGRLTQLVGGAAVATCGLVWAMGTFAAASAVLDSPATLAWPPMLVALVCLNGGFGYLLVAGARCVAVGRRAAVAP
jgi:hypothetical protein